MRLLLTTAAILISMSLGAQGIWTTTGGNYKWNRGKFDSVLIVPRDTLPTNRALVTSTGFPVGDSGRIAMKNKILYYNRDSIWVALSTGSGSLSDYYTKVQSDTIFRNYVQAKRYGAKGDGTLNDSTALKHASDSNYSVFLNQGDYLVSGLYNPRGASFFGDGRILRNITGGTQQLNSYADKYQHVFGSEYLAFVQRKLLERTDATTQIKVIWSGDSTTAGDATTTDFNLNNLFKYLMSSYGIGNINSINAGHSGQTTVTWNSTYLSSDMSDNPDLYILRWGINDGVLGDVNSFITALRSGLSTIRASKSVSQLSIILMSPNSTSDTPNGRDEKWYEQINSAIKQAARDYQCVFIDTYSMWQDSRKAADVWMDNPYSDGRAIHPLNVMNSWIVSKVTDILLPQAYARKVSASKIQNYSNVDRLESDTTRIQLYDGGVTAERAYNITKTWPLDGQTTTMKTADGIGYQLHTGYHAADSGKLYFRNAVAPDANPTPPFMYWSGWRRVAMFNDMNLQQVATTGNSYTGQIIANSFKTKTAVNNNSFFYNNESDVNRWAVGFVSDYDMGFAAYNDAGSYIATRLYLERNSGEVGIGNVSPSSTLHVTGSIATSIISVTATTTLDGTHHTVNVNNSANVTINLPAAAGCPGRIYFIKKISNNAFTVSIDPNGSENIEGLSTPQVLGAYLNSFTIQSDGTAWWIY